MVQQATANLRISGTIAIYETVEVTLFGLAYLEGGTAGAFVLFGSFFVWVSFALEIILVRSLNPKTIPSGTSQAEQPAPETGTAVQTSGTSQAERRERPRPGGGPSRDRSTKHAKQDLPLAILEAKERIAATGQRPSYQAIADLVGCSKTSVSRVLSGS
jgi:hypothetical protein